MTTAPVPVLLLDGHTTQALACARSLGRAGHPVYVASTARWALAAWSRHCRASWRLPAQTVADYAALRAWAAARGVRIVLPLTERSCLLVNAERDAWPAAGMTLGCGTDEMLLQLFDKARALERAGTWGIPVPPTCLPTSLEEAHLAAREIGFPCVVKARFSYVWHDRRLLTDPGVAYVTRPEDLDAVVLSRRQGPNWPLVQRYVAGSGKGVSALCDRGRIAGWFAHERLRDVRPSGSGSSLRRSVPVDPRLREPAARLLADLAWHGPAMLEFRYDDAQQPWLIEINGRFWGSLQLAVAAGANLPLQWVRLLAGEPAAVAASYQAGVTRRWLWGDVQRLGHIALGPPHGYPGSYPGWWRGVRDLAGPQPAGTRIETWDMADPGPAVAEWMQGVGQLLARWPRRRPAQPQPERLQIV